METLTLAALSTITTRFLLWASRPLTYLQAKEQHRLLFLPKRPEIQGLYQPLMFLQQPYSITSGIVLETQLAMF